MKKIITASIATLALSSVVYANVSTAALTKNENDKIILPVSLNNQAYVEISTDSNLIPANAKVIAGTSASIFEIELPNELGIKRVRYANGTQGCDFYIDTQGGAMPGMTLGTFITAVPIDSSSSCNVFTSGGVNHLAVSFPRTM